MEEEMKSHSAINVTSVEVMYTPRLFVNSEGAPKFTAHITPYTRTIIIGQTWNRDITMLRINDIPYIQRVFINDEEVPMDSNAVRLMVNYIRGSLIRDPSLGETNEDKING